MSTRLILAEALATHYHFGMMYGTHQDYVQYHILGVVNQMKVHHLSEEHLIVGFLHDIVEDTACTIETITALFGERIAAAVLAITKLNTWGNLESTLVNAILSSSLIDARLLGSVRKTS